MERVPLTVSCKNLDGTSTVDSCKNVTGTGTVDSYKNLDGTSTVDSCKNVTGTGTVDICKNVYGTGTIYSCEKWMEVALLTVARPWMAADCFKSIERLLLTVIKESVISLFFLLSLLCCRNTEGGIVDRCRNMSRALLTTVNARNRYCSRL